MFLYFHVFCSIAYSDSYQSGRNKPSYSFNNFMKPFMDCKSYEFEETNKLANYYETGVKYLLK